MTGDEHTAARITSRALSRFAGNQDAAGMIETGFYGAAWAGLQLVLRADDDGLLTLTVNGFGDDTHDMLGKLFEVRLLRDGPHEVVAWRVGTWSRAFEAWDA